MPVSHRATRVWVWALITLGSYWLRGSYRAWTACAVARPSSRAATPTAAPAAGTAR